MRQETRKKRYAAGREGRTEDRGGSQGGGAGLGLRRIALLTALSLLTVLVLPGLMPTAQAAERTLLSAKDAYIDLETPNSNAGTGQSIDIGFNQTPSVVRRRALIAFDLSPIPPQTILLSATAVLRCGQLKNAGTYGWHLVTSSWGELTVTWNNQPTFAALPVATENMGDTVPGGFCTVGDVVRDDITPLVQAWIDGTPNEGMIGISSNESDEEFILLRSREHVIPPFVEIVLGAPIIIAVLVVVAAIVVAMGFFNLVLKKDRSLEDLALLLLLLVVFLVGIGIAVALFAG